MKQPLYIEFYQDYIAEDNSFTWVHDVKYRIISKDDNFYYIVKNKGKTQKIPRNEEGDIYITDTIKS